MDPITAAGIGLSITSLALQVLSGCKKGYELFVEMGGMPTKYRHLRTRLRIEQTRLLTWAEKIGLVEELLHEHSRTLSLNQNLILDILLEIQFAFKSVVKVTNVYDSVVPQHEISANTSTNSQISILRRTLYHLENPSKAIARLEWAMVKQEKFEELIMRLIGYNDRIESFLDRSTLQDLRTSQERSNLLLLQVSEQVGQLRALVDAVQLGTSRGRLPETQRLSRSSTLAEPENAPASPFADLVKFKLQQKAMDSAGEDLQMLLSSSLLFPNGVPGAEPRTKTKLYGKSLWVEWSESVPETLGISDLVQMSEDRVSKLAAMLGSPNKPSAFRGPHCLGYVRQEDEVVGLRFGLVYDASSSLDDGTVGVRIQSLRDLLQGTRKPSLTSRMALARQLTESLLYLHAVNWLHKGLRSDSIMFCSPIEHAWKDKDLEAPLVSGFEFSRPDISEEITVKTTSRIEHDIYRHPDLLSYANLRSQKSHDIYSLGLVLLEIAFWEPIEVVAGISLTRKGARAAILPIRDNLLTKSFRGYPSMWDALAAEMGDDFAEAVWKCLRGGLDIGLPPKADEADPQTGARIQEAFYQEVLTRVQHGYR
ncbi:hypothetical protein H2200_011955 [Cladophialophora chaetospira]|uniref:Protein kinase domain-containing protein n=1 Tax=Cladophialophora chaetospira TaxID=386627 RepID=A0AA39CD04_9EURO|nr:hypothetical protein H2200_011955 [Cladophialophora chaetospira]